MNQIESKTIHHAYLFWRARFPAFQVDERLEPFLTSQIKPANTDSMLWIKTVREAFGLTLDTASQKANVSRNTFWKFEQSERAGTISLNTLRKSAEAMDCELIYAIRPKSKTLPSKIIWEKIYGPCIRHPLVKNTSNSMKSRVLASLAKERMEDLALRRKMGWSIRPIKK